jgi:hypothetical protein
MGNHEGYSVVSFHPADFWEGLDTELRQRYGEVLSKLPLAVSTSNGITALHGALPGVSRLESINRIKLGSDEWRQITWGDWQDREGKFLGVDQYTGRPQFGQGWFEATMSHFGKNVLVRSHQPEAPSTMYGNRCLTIFSSSAYGHHISERTVAIVDLSKAAKSTDDIEIEAI